MSPSLQLVFPSGQPAAQRPAVRGTSPRNSFAAALQAPESADLAEGWRGNGRAGLPTTREHRRNEGLGEPDFGKPEFGKSDFGKSDFRKSGFGRSDFRKWGERTPGLGALPDVLTPLPVVLAVPLAAGGGLTVVSSTLFQDRQPIRAISQPPGIPDAAVGGLNSIVRDIAVPAPQPQQTSVESSPPASGSDGGIAIDPIFSRTIFSGTISPGSIFCEAIFPGPTFRLPVPEGLHGAGNGRNRQYGGIGATVENPAAQAQPGGEARPADSIPAFRPGAKVDAAFHFEDYGAAGSPVGGAAWPNDTSERNGPFLEPRKEQGSATGTTPDQDAAAAIAPAAGRQANVPGFNAPGPGAEVLPASASVVPVVEATTRGVSLGEKRGDALTPGIPEFRLAAAETHRITEASGRAEVALKAAVQRNPRTESDSVARNDAAATPRRASEPANRQSASGPFVEHRWTKRGPTSEAAPPAVGGGPGQAVVGFGIAADGVGEGRRVAGSDGRGLASGKAPQAEAARNGPANSGGPAEARLGNANSRRAAVGGSSDGAAVSAPGGKAKDDPALDADTQPGVAALPFPGAKAAPIPAPGLSLAHGVPQDDARRVGAGGPDGRVPQVVLDATPLPASPLRAPGLGALGASAELHVSLKTVAFGRVEMHTSVRDNQVGLSLASEHGDLRGALGAETGQLDANLRHYDLQLQELRFTGQGGLHAGGQGNARHPGTGTGSGTGSDTGAESGVSPPWKFAEPDETAGGREDIALAERLEPVYRRGGLSLHV